MMKPEVAIEILELPKDPLKSGTHYHAIPSSKRISYADYLSARKAAIQALEKQVPKSYDIRCNSNGVCYDCPECGVKIDRYDKYCFNCGQRIDWSESE